MSRGCLKYRHRVSSFPGDVSASGVAVVQVCAPHDTQLHYLSTAMLRLTFKNIQDEAAFSTFYHRHVWPFPPLTSATAACYWLWTASGLAFLRQQHTPISLLCAGLVISMAAVCVVFAWNTFKQPFLVVDERRTGLLFSASLAACVVLFNLGCSGGSADMRASLWNRSVAGLTLQEGRLGDLLVATG